MLGSGRCPLHPMTTFRTMVVAIYPLSRNSSRASKSSIVDDMIDANRLLYQAPEVVVAVASGYCHSHLVGLDTARQTDVANIIDHIPVPLLGSRDLGFQCRLSIIIDFQCCIFTCLKFSVFRWCTENPAPRIQCRKH
jgi:hypothetical protein